MKTPRGIRRHRRPAFAINLLVVLICVISVGAIAFSESTRDGLWKGIRTGLQQTPEKWVASYPKPVADFFEAHIFPTPPFTYRTRVISCGLTASQLPEPAIRQVRLPSIGNDLHRLPPVDVPNSGDPIDRMGLVRESAGSLAVQFTYEGLIFLDEDGS